MRLIYVSHWRFPAGKTHALFAMKTCEAFADRGIEVELWAPRRHNSEFPHADPFAHYGIRRNFILRKLPVIDLMGILGGAGFIPMVISFAIVAFIRALPRVRDQETFFYFHDIRDAILIACVSRRCICEIHDFYKSSIEWINRFVFSKLRGLIVTNTFKLDAIAHNYRFPRERMLRQPNAVELARFDIPETRSQARARLNIPAGRTIALYTGSLFPSKGADTLVESAAHLPEKIFVYIAGGTGREREALRSRIAAEHLRRIEIIPLPYEDTQKAPLLMRAANVLVLPNSAKFEESKFETSPVKLFEYMASGTPIVAANVPSVRDIVSDREVSFFEPDNPRDVARAIMTVTNDEQAGLANARRAREKATHYTWTKRAENIADLINSLDPKSKR